MVDRSAFTPDEWQRLVSSPMLAGMAVTLAEPSGLWGMLKEGMASARVLLEAGKSPTASGLVKEIAEQMQSADGRQLAQDGVRAAVTARTAAEMKAQALAELGRIGTLLDQKAGADAPAVKAWLQQIAGKVAEASTEGGFLGFGGVEVSEAEKASLDEIAAALKA